MGDTRPRNRQDLVNRLEERWLDVLDTEYIKKVCSAAWSRLRLIVDSKGGYIKPKDITSDKSDSDSDD